MPISGANLTYVSVGGILIFSAYKGSSLTNTVQSVLSGNLNVTDTEPVQWGSASNSSSSSTAPGDTGAANNTAAANQALAKSIAISMGLSSWTTGQNWADWVSLWNKESGWSTTAANPKSDARGIAQNINGWSADYPENDPTAQIKWGINYIQGRYGTPVLAWAHEQANDWY